MNLVADIGNSFTKIAVFDGDTIMEVVRTEGLSHDAIRPLFDGFNIDAVIVSSVTGENDLYRNIFGEPGLPLFFLNALIPLPFRIEYRSPETLGSDRIAGIAGAHNKFINTTVLVIDAGTAVTYDLLLSNGTFPGGNISPGLTTRFKALNQFTGRLPLVKEGRQESLLGTDTEGAIRAGVQSGLIFEINEYIRTFKNKYKDLEVIITGGESHFLRDYINFSFTFAPDLIIEGLNHILNYNVKNN